MKELVGTFNQEKALVGAFSVIVRTGCGPDGAPHSTILYTNHRDPVSQHYLAHPLADHPDVLLGGGELQPVTV